MSPAADVYQGDRLVAHLTRSPNGVSLTYVQGVELEHGQLASKLTRSDLPVESLDLHPFFLNLLPEGARLQLLLESSRSRDDSLGLLLKVGWDSIGDVAVLPHGESFESHENSVPSVEVGDASFWDLFREGSTTKPDATVPGVQEKISSSTIAFGIRMEHAPSAILKLNPKKYPRLVHNEEFFLRMARGCGLETNRAELVYDRENEPGLLVTRFDRIKDGRRLRKLHQEDACQLLNVPPGHKYEVSMREIGDAVAEVVTAPAVEILRLLELVAFSYLIGNGDLHAKNVSVLWNRVVRLTPCYDLLSTLPYPLDPHMALQFEGRDDNFRSADFVKFGGRYGVPEKAVLTMIQRLCAKAVPWIARVGEIGFDERTTATLKRELQTRRSKLLR